MSGTITIEGALPDLYKLAEGCVEHGLKFKLCVAKFDLSAGAKLPERKRKYPSEKSSKQDASSPSEEGNGASSETDPGATATPPSSGETTA